jgi:hypothetical protein
MYHSVHVCMSLVILLLAVDDVIMCHSDHVSMCPTPQGHESRQGGSMAVGLERSPALPCGNLQKMGWKGLERAEQGWAGLGWVGLGWAGAGRDGLVRGWA